MDEPPAQPVGMAGLRYPITQVSLVVDDIDALLERYHGTFGWAPWQDFDHVPPTHGNTMYRGRAVTYSLRGAEVYVGSLNFELLKPLPGGESLFHDHLARRGEGIASIASMFHEREDGDAVKAAFRDEFGLAVINRATIGDHIEYYYVDTQRDFGCPIESGSGHAIDFVGPARVYPHPGATPGPSPASGIGYRIGRITLVVRDGAAKRRNYERAFGWAPWRVREAAAAIGDATYLGRPATLEATLSEALVGDVAFEIVEPHGGASPWQSFLDRVGEGLMGITVVPDAPAGAEDVERQLAGDGIGVLAAGTVDGVQWRLFDTEAAFTTAISAGPAPTGSDRTAS